MHALPSTLTDTCVTGTLTDAHVAYTWTFAYDKDGFPWMEAHMHGRQMVCKGPLLVLGARLGVTWIQGAGLEAEHMQGFVSLLFIGIMITGSLSLTMPIAHVLLTKYMGLYMYSLRHCIAAELRCGGMVLYVSVMSGEEILFMGSRKR